MGLRRFFLVDDKESRFIFIGDVHGMNSSLQYVLILTLNDD
jgi:hypothetical protein